MSTIENSSFPIALQSELLSLGFNATEIFNMKRSFESFRSRNPNISCKKDLLREFCNQLSIYPPTNMSKINKALILILVGNNMNDIRSSLANDTQSSLQQSFPLFQTPEQNHQYYQKIVNTIMRDVTNSPQDKAAKSLINAATSLNTAATSSTSGVTSLNQAANSLAAAATLLTDQHHSIVFVYDIDVIAMISITFITEYIIQFPEIDMAPFWNLMIGIINTTNFRGIELRDAVVTNIQQVSSNETETQRTVCDKYSSLRQFYNEISNGIRDGGPLISHELIEKCGMTSQRDDLNHAAEQLQQKYNQRWQNVKKCLELVNQKSRDSHKKFANVVISKERIAIGAAQLMISGLCSQIPIENIYSTDGWSKESVFDKIQQRFGEKCILVYVTSCLELSSVPLKVRNHTWPVEGTNSIHTLYNAQQEVLLR